MPPPDTSPLPPPPPVGPRALRLSPLAFGGAPVGNLYAEVEDAAAAQAIRQAWEGGIRHFDTAPYYGFGLSESRIGETLAGGPRGRPRRAFRLQPRRLASQPRSQPSPSAHRPHRHPVPA